VSRHVARINAVSFVSRVLYRSRIVGRPVYFVLFSGHLDPLHLHSFPTRRSSDLPPAPEKPELKPVFAPPLEEVDWAATLLECQEDRKSTRLNSSHVSISYAVFCLKKKKTKETTTWQWSNK